MNQFRPRNLPLRVQYMLVFALLSISTTAITTITLTSLSGQRMRAVLQEKSVQYARQLQQQLQSVIAFDDRLTARELFESLAGDSDVDGLAVYDSRGKLIEGRGLRPAELRSLDGAVGPKTDHVIAVAGVNSREGKTGRLYVGLSTRSIDRLHRRDSWIAAVIASVVVLLAFALGVQTSRRLARRLVRIADAANRVASGDTLHVGLDDSSKDEIGELSHAFNVMVAELSRLSAEHERMVITERERLENLVAERTADLEQSREMFRLMAESTNAIPFTLNLTTACFTYIGSQAIVDTGIQESEWREPGALDKFIPRDKNVEVRTRFDECSSGPFEFEATVLRRDASRCEFRWTGTCEHRNNVKLLRGLMQDVTALRRLERELAAAQKLESVGRLAAGVAHEINTPVQFVSDNVQFVRTTMEDLIPVVAAYRTLAHTVLDGGEAHSAAESAQAAEAAADLDYLLENVPLATGSAIEGLDRIATIVRSMKEFAHPDQAEMSNADLNQAIRSTLVIARNEYKYIATVDARFDDLPPVRCYLGEINQVILNLIVNAAHAISDVVAGTDTLGCLTIRTRHGGDWVEISIADTGTGIPENVRDKLFDPFFTTKEVGKGTGQGLAIARSVVVNKHGGSLRFETEVGRGTTFIVRLPVQQAALPTDASKAAA